MIALMGETPRSRAYLQSILTHQLSLSKVYILSTGEEYLPFELDHIHCPVTHIEFLPNQSLIETCLRYNLPYEVLPTLDLNSEIVYQAMESDQDKLVLFSAPRKTKYGSILRERILSLAKDFIHIHPGITPKYKGSTVMYYSLILEGKIGVSLFYLNQGLDEGEPLHKMEFTINAYPYEMDEICDPCIRSCILIDFLKGNSLSKPKLDSSHDNTFYVIHPTLKHLALQRLL